MKELSVNATIENIAPVTDFVNGELEALDCPKRVQRQIDVAIDELFGNIAHYAYRPEQLGEATVRCCVGGSPLQVTIQFLDNGTPFNPLAKEDADITLSAEERKIGGLGILMVKKSMDAVDYTYEGGKNILTIKKSI